MSSAKQKVRRQQERSEGTNQQKGWMEKKTATKYAEHGNSMLYWKCDCGQATGCARTQKLNAIDERNTRSHHWAEHQTKRGFNNLNYITDISDLQHAKEKQPTLLLAFRVHLVHKCEGNRYRLPLSPAAAVAPVEKCQYMPFSLAVQSNIEISQVSKRRQRRGCERKFASRKWPTEYANNARLCNSNKISGNDNSHSWMRREWRNLLRFAQPNENSIWNVWLFCGSGSNSSAVSSPPPTAYRFYFLGNFLIKKRRGLSAQSSSNERGLNNTLQIRKTIDHASTFFILKTFPFIIIVVVVRCRCCLLLVFTISNESKTFLVTLSMRMAAPWAKKSRRRQWTSARAHTHTKWSMRVITSRLPSFLTRF